jgi:outer membrane receptor protein involved in Fe transport
MSRHRNLKLALAAGAGALALTTAGMAVAQTRDFDVPAGDLGFALELYARQSGVQIIYKTADVSGVPTRGTRGALSPDDALNQLLEGTTFQVRRDPSGAIALAQAGSHSGPQSSSAAGGGAEVEALIVTAQKREEDIQDVPIAISAFSQEQLETHQIAGGPDLMTQVPNMTFTKTNFTGYSIQLRGIGTQAISATTDAAVAVAFNNTPFIRNRFFEQEFYDLQRVEVLRGPQGTLYGRNATAGVVNLISQKPKFAYEAKLLGDISNYSSTRLEGMLNIPLAEDKVALRLAGAWTKREGFVTNEITGNPIDGRDLWSTRLSLRVAPTDGIDVNLIWEHFEENDDRLRSGKQLCHQDDRTPFNPGIAYSNIYSQGCLPASLYSPDSFEAPDGYSLPYYLPLAELGLPVKPGFNPYASLVQSRDLRVIESTIDPIYTAKSDLVELQFNVDIGDMLTLTSETSYNYDTIFSMEDYNRFNTAPGAFSSSGNFFHRQYMQVDEDGVAYFCDPQLGCANRVVAADISTAKSSQFSQELRLSSDYDGPFNFSLGANYLRYDTEDKYYVIINTLNMFVANGAYQNFGDLTPWQPGVTDNRECLIRGFAQADPSQSLLMSGCIYMDPNPIGSLNDLGHNYFLSKNPYKLISYAVFGEAYYNFTENLKLTAGLRWTVDQKEAPRIPSWLIGSNSVGYPVLAVEEQEWREPTGRLTLDWKPDLPFTDDTLLYASYAHGYKAGGSNPPPSGVAAWGLEGFNGNETPTGIALAEQSAAKPKTFEPEFVDSIEFGAKNTMLDGALTLNLAAFYYDYKSYQISQIVDRSAVNYNFDATIWGLEVEADWRPLENLRLGFKGGYEHTEIADGERAIDILERNAGHGPDSDEPWVVLRPFPSFPSNCVLPQYVVDAGLQFNGGEMGPCEFAYALKLDPATHQAYVADPRPDYRGYNPELDVGQNNGEGFFKELGGNELPNAPHMTATITADYTVPLPRDWLVTLHTDLYYQSEAWTRVFNTEGYDKLKAYTNVNLAAIFTNEEAGWKVMAYVKNVMDRDSITGAFLNSDDTGLTTNVFLTEPRLYGLRVTKEVSGGPWWTGANPDHVGPYPLTVEISGQVQRQDAPYGALAPAFVSTFSDAIDPTATQNRDLDWGDGREIRLTYRPGGQDFFFTAGMRYGKANSGTSRLHATEAAGPERCWLQPEGPFGGGCDPDDDDDKYISYWVKTGENWSDSSSLEREEHDIVDFAMGKDVGLGILRDSHSSLSAGLRFAQFQSSTSAILDGIPNTDFPEAFAYFPMTFDHYRAEIDASREFQGVGPALSWDAAQRLWGSDYAGHVDLDWGLTGGVLFGKQTTDVTGTQGSAYTSMKYGQLFGSVMTPLSYTPIEFHRRQSVKTPFVDARLGLSYEIQRFKVGAGYRWERYFDVLDGGYAGQRDYDRTIDGPYFKIAVGFGG